MLITRSRLASAMLLLLLSAAAFLPAPVALAQDAGDPEDALPKALKPDTPVTGSFVGGTEVFRSYYIDVPAGTTKLHIAVYDATADVDIYAKHGSPIEDWEDGDYDHGSETGRVDEELIITTSSEPPLKRGRYYVDVMTWVEEASVTFTIVFAFDKAPGLPPLKLPPYRPMTSLTPLQRAVDACVSIECDGGGGSGTVLSADGLIVTNAHVLEYATDEDEDGDGDNTNPASDAVTGPLQEDDIIVAFTDDVRRVPRQLFLAKAIKIDRELDLALLKIKSDLRNHVHDPAKNPLTWLPIGAPDKLYVDDPLRVLGFPALGGTRARSSLTLTRGVVSGFEMGGDDKLHWIKTDTHISSGNSGGTCINAACELVGMPTMVMYDEDARSGLSGR
ncbi:MAG: S1C family serine protease [Planctomycetota bacterium]